METMTRLVDGDWVVWFQIEETRSKLVLTLEQFEFYTTENGRDVEEMFLVGRIEPMTDYDLWEVGVYAKPKPKALAATVVPTPIVISAIPGPMPPMTPPTPPHWPRGRR